jgi:hypothetical protein
MTDRFGGASIPRQWLILLRILLPKQSIVCNVNLHFSGLTNFLKRHDAGLRTRIRTLLRTKPIVCLNHGDERQLDTMAADGKAGERLALFA